MNAASGSPPKRRATKSKPRAAATKPRAESKKPGVAKAKPRAAAKTARASKSPAAKSRPVETASFVYVLGSFHKGRYLSYVGWTNDVARRVDQHNAGTGARTTRGRAWVLLHTEAFETRVEAMSREWHLKRDRAFRKKLMDDVKAGQ